MDAGDDVLATLGGFLDDIQEAATLPQVGQAFLALANQLSFERVVIVDVVELKAQSKRAVIFTTDTPEQALKAQTYPSHHIGQHAAENGAPFTLDELRALLAIDPEEWKKSLPGEAQHGTALILPVHKNGQVVLKCGCSGVNGDDTPLARSLLHTAAHLVYDRIIAINERGQVALTRRETECYNAMSGGKSIAEIAELSGISANTARRHLKSAVKKLGIDTPLETLVTQATRKRRRAS